MTSMILLEYTCAVIEMILNTSIFGMVIVR